MFSPSKQKTNYQNKEDCYHRTAASTSVDYPKEHTYDRIQRIKHQATNDPQIKWSRNNIALTMEYFEPISSTSTPKRYSSQTDYSYAYYEPGVAMRHSNIPKPNMLKPDRLNGSKGSSPKSIRSLLSKPSNDKTTSNRHTYTTRYGTQENIYEDVSSIGTRSILESSSRSLNTQECPKVEFQDILHNHYRVLEELNLSVEELLLSTTKKVNLLSPRKMLKRSSKPRTKNRHSNNIGSKSDFPSSMHELLVGEDSGFSGSSSGASYIGNLRNYKTALTRSHRNSTEINTPTNISDCGTYQSTNNVKNSNEPRNVSLQIVNQLDGAKCSGSSKGLKFPFWSKR